MLTQAHRLPIRPNPIAQLAKDKMGIAYGQSHGLKFSLLAHYAKPIVPIGQVKMSHRPRYLVNSPQKQSSFYML